MGLATFSIYKYVRTSKGWRYCKPIYGKNNKLQCHSPQVHPIVKSMTSEPG